MCPGKLLEIISVNPGNIQNLVDSELRVNLESHNQKTYPNRQGTGVICLGHRVHLASKLSMTLAFRP